MDIKQTEKMDLKNCSWAIFQSHSDLVSTTQLTLSSWGNLMLNVRIYLPPPKWQSTPALLPGKSHGRRSLIGYNPWGRKESDMTERLHFHFSNTHTLMLAQVGIQCPVSPPSPHPHSAPEASCPGIVPDARPHIWQGHFSDLDLPSEFP